MLKVAILDDDPTMLDAVEILLVDAGFSCFAFCSGRQLIRALHRETFDLFILDWNVPDLSGINVLEWIRNNIGHQPPVLLLTSRVAEEEIVAGLRSGADDFVSKPFCPPILMARVEALARRTLTDPDKSNEIYGLFEFDLTGKRLTVSGAEIKLTPKEFSLSLLVFRNLNRAISRSYMLETIWGKDPTLSSRTLDVHIAKLRTKLNLRPENGYRLLPVYGYGYRLEENFS